MAAPASALIVTAMRATHRDRTRPSRSAQPQRRGTCRPIAARTPRSRYA